MPRPRFFSLSRPRVPGAWVLSIGLAIGHTAPATAADSSGRDATAVWSASAGAPMAAPQLLTLSAGQTQTLGGQTLQFLRAEDARCRPDERCRGESAEGAAVLWLRVSAADRPPQELMLVLAPERPDERLARAGTLQLELLGLNPPGRRRPGDGTAGPQAQLRVSTGLRLSLPLDQPVALPGSDASLRLSAVNDQRCPRDLQCASAGEATAQFELSRPGQAPQRLALRTPTRDLIFTVAQGLEVELCSLSPTRASTEGQQAPGVTATVFVLPEGEAARRHPRRALCGP